MKYSYRIEKQKRIDCGWLHSIDMAGKIYHNEQLWGHWNGRIPV